MDDQAKVIDQDCGCIIVIEGERVLIERCWIHLDEAIIKRRKQRDARIEAEYVKNRGTNKRCA
jgi:hypothetical protein